MSEEDYTKRGVMRSISAEQWDRYWQEKAGNKAKDCTEKHSNLFKAMRKCLPIEEEKESNQGKGKDKNRERSKTPPKA